MPHTWFSSHLPGTALLPLTAKRRALPVQLPPSKQSLDFIKHHLCVGDLIFLSPPLLRCHLLPASTSLQHLTNNSNGTGPRVSHSHLLLSGHPLRLKLRPQPGVPAPSLLKHSGANAPKSVHPSPLAHPGHHPRLPVPWQWPHHCPPCLHGPSCKQQPPKSRVTLPLRGFRWFPTVRRMEKQHLPAL